MKWGRTWGNYWGQDSVSNIKIVDLENYPPEAIAYWDSVASGVLYHVYVDGKFYETTYSTEIMLQFISTGRHWVEIFIGGDGTMDEDLSDFLSTVPGTRVKLSWTTSTSDDVNYYKIYWDSGDGSAFSYIGRTKDNIGEWISDVLDDGSYEFRVNPVDDAGNERTSAHTVVVVISRYPNPPSSLELDSYDESTSTASFTFVESTTTGITGYKVYHNGGSGNIDYDTEVLLVAAGNTSFDLTLGSGDWDVAVRAYNGSYTEDNVDVHTEFSVGGSPVDLLEDSANIPFALAAIPAAGGTITLKCSYDAFEEKSSATTINFYANDGLGGSVNYTTTIATATVPTHTTAEMVIFEIETTSSALVDGRTYTFAAKSATSGGTESDASDTTTAIADATLPADIAALSGEAVNYEE